MLKRLIDYRLLYLIFPAVLALYALDDVITAAWLHLLLAVPLLVGVALLLRKYIFHVDVSMASDIALQDPIAASIVVLADRIFMVGIVLSGVVWLSRL